LLDQGKRVTQETRLWNENRDQTEPMRTKENAQDYRYFPEPDLPVFAPDPAFRASVEAALVELPAPRMERLEQDYGLSREQAELIGDEKALADYFEEALTAVAAEGFDTQDGAGRIANWLLTDIKHILGREGIALSHIGSFRLSPRRLATLVVMVARGQVSMKNGKQAMERVITEDRDPAELIREAGWEQLSDPVQIGKAVEAVYAAEAAVFAQTRAARAAGNQKRQRTLTAYLVGRVLEQTGGRADPTIAGAQIESLVQTL
jgi:aspartyl-tRNA(Asn)/glutamyl-tRNA(Gln) amidotransferase subunit B